MNLNIVQINVLSSKLIQIEFNSNLLNSLNSNNFVIVAQNTSIPSPKIINIIVIDNFVEITVQPLTPYEKYKLQLVSPFYTNNGELLNLNNQVYFFIGYQDESELIRNNLKNYLINNIYDLDLSNAPVKELINSRSKLFSQALFDIKEFKNDNYLSLLIENEAKIRGSGPYDRLNEGGAYEIVSVSKNLPGNVTSISKSFDDFPNYPITLQSIDYEETLFFGSNNGSFSNLLLNLSKNNIVKVNSITIEYNNGIKYIYSIEKFGYTINNNRYDESFGSSSYLLESNQVSLNENILSETSLPSNNDKIKISYEYKNKGRIVSNVNVYQIYFQVRESVPPITTSFSLKHSSILDSNYNPATFGAIEFLDPNANPPFSSIHPAFKKEKIFNLDSLPSAPGEFSVDYINGRVFVYGINKDGTGEFPPVCSYFYRKNLINNLDYTFDPSLYEVAASSLRELIGTKASISFDYEDMLIEKEDFIAQIHEEVINERVNNNLIALNAIKTQKSPITNVFRIFNETSGEVYNIQRWNDTTIFFTSNFSPKINSSLDNVSFSFSQNETLFISNTYSNNIGIKIIKFTLKNNPIIGSSQDSTGSSFNSSINFSKKDLFKIERYFDSQTDTLLNQLNNLLIGQYFVDYISGEIYLAVNLNISDNFGSIDYRYGKIKTNNSHIYGVEDLYYLIGTNNINKKILVKSFDDTTVTPSFYDRSDERFKNNDSSNSYIVNNSTIAVTDDIFEVRGIYDLFDLKNNNYPLNFATNSSFSFNVISLSSIDVFYNSVISSGLEISLPRPSLGIEIESVVSVKNSNNVEYWDNLGIINDFNLTLSGINSPQVGESVKVLVKLKLNGSATPIVDYSKGNYLIDYNYIFDELVISYEYGNNLLDFRTSNSLQEGDTYFITYKAGALRDALVKNFGLLFDLSVLKVNDLSVDREIYRRSLIAAMQMIPRGATIEALKNIVSIIIKVEPEIIEAAFEAWSLGVSYLSPEPIKISGQPELMPGKFGNGLLFSKKNDALSMPVESSIRIEEGTFETWIIPTWNGLDNDASLTFSLFKNNQPINSEEVYIGDSGYHPEINQKNEFILDKYKNVIGIPSPIFTQTGFFIYFETFENKWKILAKDLVSSSNIYSGKIRSSGKVYGIKNIQDLGEINDILRSGNSEIDFEFHLDENIPDGYETNDGYVSGYTFDGIELLSDDKHYFLDIGKNLNKNRISLFKDGNGYLVFEVFDKNGFKANVCSNISSWNSYEKHHVAISWKLNTVDFRDEIHLFIDGQEIPNVLKYGGLPAIVAGDKFRSVKPEIVISSALKISRFGDDLILTADSNVVYSTSFDFESENIVSGDQILLIEFGTTFTILDVNGKFLTLDSNINVSLENVSYSINPISTEVATQLSLYNNFAVYVNNNELPGLRAQYPHYKIEKNIYFKDILTIFGNVNIGDIVSLKTLGLNHRRVKEKIYLWNSSSVLKTFLPEPISIDEVKIISYILPLSIITKDNSINLGPNWNKSFSLNQPSSDGRTLQVRIIGNNFSSPLNIIINGNVSETLIFNGPGIKTTSNKFSSLTSVDVFVTPIFLDQTFFSIEIFEKYSITRSEGTDNYPIIRYSYIFQTGDSLNGSGNIIQDLNKTFLDSSVGQFISIDGVGVFKILLKIDENTLKIEGSISVVNKEYQIYYLGPNNSGFENGFFTLQNISTLNPYFLPKGTYEFDYSTYLSLQIDPIVDEKLIIGTDLTKTFSANAILDEIICLSNSLSDVRIGESSDNNSITKNYLKLSESVPSPNTLKILHMNNFPIKNSAKFYSSWDGRFIQSGNGVNSSFGQSLFADGNSFIIENNGILNEDTGTVEFWINPKYDTINDPKERYYVDATTAIEQKVTSITKNIIKLDNPAQRIISITISNSNSDENFFEEAILEKDRKTIVLEKSLPFSKTKVKISYLPVGVRLERFSIFKNKESYLCFKIISDENIFEAKSPILWKRNTWHRIMAIYKFNSKDNKDQIKLIVDGEESGTIVYGQGFTFGQGFVFGQSWANVSNTIYGDINLINTMNFIYIGTDYLEKNAAQARIDNLRISNIQRLLPKIGSQYKDLNYSSNTDIVFPVTEDLYTTYLMNFDTYISLQNDFAIIRDEKFGIYNFTMNIIDSFGIIEENSYIKNILESLIKFFKPAYSKVKINYDK